MSKKVQLLGLGSNGKSQLGHLSIEDTRIPIPSIFLINNEKTIDLPFKIKQVICGGSHTLVLTSDNDIYISGDNSKGQLNIKLNHNDNEGEGEKEINQISCFTPVEGKWKLASAGFDYTCLVSLENEVYVCGEGPKGQLGLRIRNLRMIKKIPIKFISNIISIKSSINHTILLLENGDVWGWGSGRHGQIPNTIISNNNDKNIFWYPVKLDIDPVFDISVGVTFSLFKFKDMSYKIFGKDKHSTNIHLKLIPKNNNSIADSKRNSKLDCGWSFTYLHDTFESKIYKLSSHLVANSYEDLTPLLENVKLMAVGSEHVIALLKNGKVAGLGWNEHGNCGHGESNDGDGIIINGLKTVLNLFAGCATSWIVVEESS